MERLAPALRSIFDCRMDEAVTSDAFVAFRSLSNLTFRSFGLTP